jgi:cysteine desulfurase
VYGPKGVGALYIRRGIAIEPIIIGGDQEAGLRAGTENVPAAAAFAEALTLCKEYSEAEASRLIKLRDVLIRKIIEIEPGRIILNGDAKERLPNNINVSILDCDTEFLTLQLDAAGFTVSTKSACMGAGEASYVVGALNGENWRANHTLRISLGRFTKPSDIISFVSTLKKFLSTPSSYTSNALHQKFI